MSERTGAGDACHHTVVRLPARLRPKTYDSMAPVGKRPLKTLERVLSKAGLGSRTEARQWVAAKRVRVNGRVVEDPDAWVDLERDRVTFDGKPVRKQESTYILLYKPAGYLTTYRDPQGRPTIYDLLPDRERYLFPVGRLDLETSGRVFDLMRECHTKRGLTSVIVTHNPELAARCDRVLEMKQQN